MSTQRLAPPTNALALAGFILGAVSASLALVLGWLGLFVAFVPALIAIVFGFVGITTANRLGGVRKQMATWAVVLGFATLVVPWLRQALLGF